MIKVIRHGYIRYYINCTKCSCYFSYELTDLEENKVKCPDCGEEHVHSVCNEVDSMSLIKE